MFDFLFRAKAWTEMPRGFFLAAVLLFVAIDFAAPMLGVGQSMLIAVRIVQAALILGLAWQFKVFAALGFVNPERQDVIRFAILAGVSSAIALAALALMPAWRAEVTMPGFVAGFEGLVLMMVVAPIVEELFFRGILYTMLRQSMAPIYAILLTAACFALMHGLLISPQLFGGVVFAVAYEWTRKLWVPMALHSGANAAVWILSGL